MSIKADDLMAEVTAVVLAGGLGTRLRDVLPDRQKVIADISGKPFIDRILTQLRDAGVKRAILAVGHHAEQVSAHVAQSDLGPMVVTCSVENTPLGTGGAVRHALAHIEGEDVLVMNGDSFVDMDMGAFVAFHHHHQAEISMLLVEMDCTGRYGAAQLGANGIIERFAEKTQQGRGLINAGVYMIRKHVIENMAADVCSSLEVDVFPAHCGRGVYGMVQNGKFIDIGTPESLKAAETFFE